MRISTKSITNFDASASTEPRQRHHEVQDQWQLMQGTEVQNMCAENQADRTCISRHQRDILWISRNIGCKLVFVRFFENVKSTFCTVSRSFKFGIVYQFPSKTTTDEQFPRSACCVRVFCYHISQLCRNDTNVSSCHTQQDFCLNASASRPDLSLKPRQADEEGAKAP